MSPLLVCCTKRLSNIAIKSNDDEEISCMSMATITMGINTIEAFLLEFSHFTKPTHTQRALGIMIIFLESIKN